jgi:hypothetical protein
LYAKLLDARQATGGTLYTLLNPGIGSVHAR